MADKYITKLERDTNGELMADPVIIVGGSASGTSGSNITVNGQTADSKGNIDLNAKHITTTDGNVQADIDALKAGIHPASTENQAIVSLRRDLDDLQKRHSAFATTTLADLANKLDLDLGNVKDTGFLEKLRDAKVAFKSDIPKPSAPVVPVGQTTSVSYQEIHEQDNRMLKLNTDVNFINLQLPSTGKEFAVTLPQSKAGTTIILGSMIHPEDSTPDAVQVNAPTGWQIQGGSSYTETNVIERWLYIVSTGSGYLVGKMFSKEELNEKENDITITDSLGHSVTGKNFILGRGIVVRTGDKHSSMSVYEDSPENENIPDVYVDGSQTYAQLEENSVIDLAPAVIDELIGNDGFYAKLGRQEELVVPTGKNTVKAKLYPEDIIVDTKGYIQVNRADKSFGIQDALDDDPNISGGQPAVVASILSMYGVAPENGTVTFYIYDEYTKQPVMDIMGKPMQVSKDYKAGDKLGKLHLEDVVMDKGIRNISLYVEPTFKTDSVVIKEDTCLLIQYITDKHQTGEALRTFEAENGINLTWYKEYVGKDFFTLGHYLDEDVAEGDLNAGDGMLGNDGVQFYAATKMKASIKDRVMYFKDNGTDICYFNVGKVFSPEETTLLEDEYKFYNGIAKFDMNTGNRFASLRYTINSKPTKFPVGVDTDKDITNVMAWKDSGYAGEGVIEANKDMVISELSVTFDRTLHFGEKKAKGNDERLSTFFTIGNTPDNPIRETEMSSMFTDAAAPDTRLVTHTTPCNIKLNKGQDLWFWANALVDDGLYVQAPTNGVLLEIQVKYEEVKKI